MMKNKFLSSLVFISILVSGCASTTEFSTNEGKISTSEADYISSIEVKMVSMEKYIKSLEGKISSLEARVTRLEKETKSNSDKKDVPAQITKPSRFNSGNNIFPDDDIDVPENSLNLFNTYWDSFNGLMEKGKVYQYSNKGFIKDLQFKIFRVYDNENAVLVARESHNCTYKGKFQMICDEAVFLILTKQNYAEGVSLKEGMYECTGTYTFKGNNGDKKTVYVLREMADAK